MKVYWDSHGLCPTHSGISRHIRGLLRGLYSIDGPLPYLLRSNSPWFSHRVPHAFLALSKLCFKVLRSQDEHDFHILHSFANLNQCPFSVFKARRLRRVLTVHDVIPLLLNDGSGHHAQYKYLMPRTLRHVDAVIAVSSWTRNLLCDSWPWLSDRIWVIPNGHMRRKSPVVSGCLRSEASRGDGFSLLAVARDEPYKRLDLLLEVAEQLGPVDCLRIVTCSRGKRRLGKRLEQEGMKGPRPVLLSGLSDAELADEYQRADAFLHPSLYEGFGLPVAEALRAGLPVVYVKGSALDEYVPKSLGIGLSPQSVAEEFVEATRVLVGKRDLGLLERSFEHYRRNEVQWEEVARNVTGVYASICC